MIRQTGYLLSHQELCRRPTKEHFEKSILIGHIPALEGYLLPFLGEKGEKYKIVIVPYKCIKYINQ